MLNAIKKTFLFIKNFLHGTVYVASAAGFILLIAAIMFYFRPTDMLLDAAVYPHNPFSADAKLALRLLDWGARLLVLGLGLAMALPRIEQWALKGWEQCLKGWAWVVGRGDWFKAKLAARKEAKAEAEAKKVAPV